MCEKATERAVGRTCARARASRCAREETRLAIPRSPTVVAFSSRSLVSESFVRSWREKIWHADLLIWRAFTTPMFSAALDRSLVSFHLPNAQPSARSSTGSPTLSLSSTPSRLHGSSSSAISGMVLRQ